MSLTHAIPPEIYEKWLSIPAVECPPNYYGLLGLPLYESDVDAIKRAGDERIKLVRPKCLKHRELGTQVLNEIAKARVCLTDGDRKEAYDESLKHARDRRIGLVRTITPKHHEVETQVLSEIAKVQETVTARGRKAAHDTSLGRVPMQTPEIAAVQPMSLAFRPKCELRGHKHTISCVAFDPQGLLLASASYDGTTKIWRLGTGQVRATLDDSVDTRSRLKAQTRGARAPLTQAAFSPDGAFFATAGDDTTPKLWDVTNGELRQVLDKNVEDATIRVATALAFQPKTPLLAVGYKQRAVEIWDVDECRFIRNVACPTKDLAFSPDGLTLVTSRCVWDFDTGKLKCQFDRDEGSANCLTFAGDGTFLVTGTATGVHFWEAATGVHQATLRNRDVLVKSMAISPDGAILATGLVSGEVEIWDVSARRFLFHFEAHKRVVESVAFSPDNSLLATGGKDAVVKLWDICVADDGSVPGSDKESLRPAAAEPPSDRTTGGQLWCKFEDQTAGPFSAAQARRLVQAGHLKRDTLVSLDGKNWVPAEKVRGLGLRG